MYYSSLVCHVWHIVLVSVLKKIGELQFSLRILLYRQTKFIVIGRETQIYRKTADTSLEKNVCRNTWRVLFVTYSARLR